MSIGRIRALLKEVERRRAKESLAIYAGLHIPAEIEADDLPGLHKLSLPARYIPAAHHRLILEKLQALEAGILDDREFLNLMIFSAPGTAKALALDTPIPTPSGWKTMGELAVGDVVFDERGQVCHVTWKSEVWRDRPVYRVATDCGDEIVADRDHEWLVRLCGKPRAPNKGGFDSRPWRPFKIKETWELARRRAKRPMIERAKALELPNADLPIDPYLLGVWLGDGHSSGMRMTASVEDQPWLRAEIERLGYVTKDSSVQTLFGISGVRGKFAALGLINDPLHSTHGRKHIPPIYMRGSIAQRKALLQGLIDTDGTACKRQGCATFCNTNKELAEGVRELVRSLGRKAGWIEGRATLYGKDCGPVYRVQFYMEDAARLPRKLALCRDQRRTPNTYIDVTPAGVADTVCIEVDSPSHLFLCGRSMTPTHNSTYASAIFPSWYLGRHPANCVIQGSYNDSLASRFGRRARNLFASDVHHSVFGVGLAPDQKAAGQWETELGGEYFSFGVNTGVTGRRADLVILDDLVKGRKEADSKTVRDSTWETYIGDVRTRMKPKARKLYIATRWHENDPAGRILPKEALGKSGWFKANDGEWWYVLNFSAVIETPEDEANDPLGRKIGERIWPEWFPEGHFEQERRSQGERNWNALFKGMPRPDEGAILKKQHWQKWPGKPPKCEYVISVYDTAFEEGEENDYTARTTWGIFWHEGQPVEPVEPRKKGEPYRKPPPAGRYCTILLERFKDKVEFPELRRLAKQHYDEFRPDRVLVEKKSSGHSLIQELRRNQVPVVALKADASKLARAHAASPVLEDGCVFVPTNRHGEIMDWAQDVIDDCAAATFQKGSPGNDIGDTCVYAWLHLRSNFRVEMKGENDDEDAGQQGPRPRPFG